MLHRVVVLAGPAGRSILRRLPPFGGAVSHRALLEIAASGVVPGQRIMLSGGCRRTVGWFSTSAPQSRSALGRGSDSILREDEAIRALESACATPDAKAVCSVLRRIAPDLRMSLVSDAEKLHPIAVSVASAAAGAHSGHTAPSLSVGEALSFMSEIVLDVPSAYCTLDWSTALSGPLQQLFRAVEHRDIDHTQRLVRALHMKRFPFNKHHFTAGLAEESVASVLLRRISRCVSGRMRTGESGAEHEMEQWVDLLNSICRCVEERHVPSYFGALANTLRYDIGDRRGQKAAELIHQLVRWAPQDKLAASQCVDEAMFVHEKLCSPANIDAVPFESAMLLLKRAAEVSNEHGVASGRLGAYLLASANKYEHMKPSERLSRRALDRMVDGIHAMLEMVPREALGRLKQHVLRRGNPEDLAEIALDEHASLNHREVAMVMLARQDFFGASRVLQQLLRRGTVVEEQLICSFFDCIIERAAHEGLGDGVLRAAVEELFSFYTPSASFLGHVLGECSAVMGGRSLSNLAHAIEEQLPLKGFRRRDIQQLLSACLDLLVTENREAAEHWFRISATLRANDHACAAMLALLEDDEMARVLRMLDERVGAEQEPFVLSRMCAAHLYLDNVDRAIELFFLQREAMRHRPTHEHAPTDVIESVWFVGQVYQRSPEKASAVYQRLRRGERVRCRAHGFEPLHV